MYTDHARPVTRSFGRWIPNYRFEATARDIDEVGPTWFADQARAERADLDRRATDAAWDDLFLATESGTCPGCGRWSDSLTREHICDKCLTRQLERGM